MKKLIFATLAVIGLLNAHTALAIKPGAMGIGIQGTINFPVSKQFGDNFDMGYGGIASFQYNLDKKLVLIGSIGYSIFNAKNSVSDASSTYSIIPILYGIRYGFSDKAFMPYVGFELGAFVQNSKTSFTIFGSKQETSTNQTNFGTTVAFGFYIPIGNIPLDVNGKYNMIYTSDEMTTFIGVNAGVRIPF